MNATSQDGTAAIRMKLWIEGTNPNERIAHANLVAVLHTLFSKRKDLIHYFTSDYSAKSNVLAENFGKALVDNLMAISQGESPTEAIDTSWIYKGPFQDSNVIASADMNKVGKKFGADLFIREAQDGSIKIEIGLTSKGGSAARENFPADAGSIIVDAQGKMYATLGTEAGSQPQAVELTEVQLDQFINFLRDFNAWLNSPESIDQVVQ